VSAGGLSEQGLQRLYAVCADLDAELGSLAAELSAGQLRSLVTSVLGASSALQWYAVRRLGGLPEGDDGHQPGRDDDGQGAESTGSAAPPGGVIGWAELYRLAEPYLTSAG
jgi:hypothetical protein